MLEMEISDAEMVELLIDSLNNLEGSPLNMTTVAELDRILKTLNQYVTLVKIDSKGRLGTVDIDMIINEVKNFLYYTMR